MNINTDATLSKLPLTKPVPQPEHLTRQDRSARAARLNRSAGQTTANELTTAQPSTSNSLTTAPPAPEVKPESLSLAGLLSDWGKGDSPYDLNKDGTVDGSDLGQWLSKAAEEIVSPSPASPPETPNTETTPQGSTTLEELLDSWGQGNPEQDLNGDGTVDGSDLGILLGGIDGNSGAEPSPTKNPAGTQAAAEHIAHSVLSSNDGNKDGLLTQKDLGISKQLFANLDQDSDGYINRADLTGALNDKLSSALQNQPDLDLNLFAQRWTSALDGSEGKYQPRDETAAVNNRHHHLYAKYGGSESPANTAPKETQTDTLADRLHERLQKAGFGDSPPRNLDSIVNSLGLKSHDSSAVMRRLASNYPNYFSLNILG